MGRNSKYNIKVKTEIKEVDRGQDMATMLTAFLCLLRSGQLCPESLAVQNWGRRSTWQLIGRVMISEVSCLQGQRIYRQRQILVLDSLKIYWPF